jgi:uncharacterized protein HemX
MSTAVRSDPSLDDEPTESVEAVESAPPPRTRRPSTRALAAALVAALAAAVVGYLAVQLQHSRADVERLEAAQTTRAQVLERSRELAVALTTYDYRDLAAQQRQLAQGSTDAFQQKFAETNKTLGPMFVQLEASAKGTVVDAAVQQVRGDLATALVFVDQEASSKQSAKPTTQASRLRMHLVRHGDSWLLDSVDLL